MPSTYTRPTLYPKQEAAIFCPERFAAIEASTKSGKTVGSIAWIVEQAFKYKSGQNAWWVAPVFPQADIAYRRIKQFLTQGSFQAYASPQPRIELVTGGTIWIKSADNPDSLYGEDVYDAVLDEASRAKPESWTALRTTLTATVGRCRLIGNVKGRKNFFYNLARRAQRGELPNWHYAKITYLDALEAGVLDEGDIEDARLTMSEREFQELYLAEAAEDTGNPFGLEHIRACIRGALSPNPVSAWGIDLAKKQDYLVLIGLDSQGNVSAFHRWRGVPWRDSIRRIHNLVGEDTPALVDSTGVGDPVLEELQYEHGNFVGYPFSSVSKQKLMEGLAVSIQGHELGFPEGVITNELESFEYVILPSGVRYSAPEGSYDDTVCALALAREQWSQITPGANLTRFYTLQAKKNEAREAKLESTSQNEFPWREDTEGPPEQEDMETHSVYLEALRGLTEEPQQICKVCKLPILGATRISDGFDSWHPACTSLKIAA